MKLIKTSAIALAMSAVLAGPVLAQGTSADPQVRGGAQGKGSMQKGMSGSGDEDFNAQPGTPTLAALFSDRLQTASSLGLPRSIRPAATKNVGPRFGVAYGIGANTVIRGAYGIFFLFPETAI